MANTNTAFSESDKYKNLLSAIVQAAVDGIITIDSRGTILAANPAIERIFGYPPDNLIGQNIGMLMPSPDRLVHDRYISNYLDTSDAKIIGIGREVTGLRRNGETIPLDLSVSETRTDDGILFTGIVRDLTERSKALELTLAKEAADRANAAKSEFLSRMSHELRTPLNSVLGFAQLLEMGYDDKDIRNAAASILKAGKHLLGLINEVLDLSGIEAGRLALSLEPISLSSVIQQAVDLLQPQAEHAGVDIVVDMRAATDQLVMADNQRLLQVIINVLANAVKYNRRGGIAEIVCTDLDGDSVQVLFKDTGHGIAPEEQNKLFQPFERLGNVTVEGTGLGLVLSRRLAELMKGGLWLAESGSSGSVFRLTLQKAKNPNSMSASHSGKPGRRKREFGPATILYIEDSLPNSNLLEMVFAPWPDIELISTTHGFAGLEMARSIPLSIILLDLHLPDVEGVHILGRLKEDLSTANIPVIVISADATPGQIDRLQQAGAYHYLTKPIDINELLDLVEQITPLREPSD